MRDQQLAEPKHIDGQQKEMQAKYRGKPNEQPVGDERDVAEDGKDAQKAHVLGQERQ